MNKERGEVTVERDVTYICKKRQVRSVIASPLSVKLVVCIMTKKHIYRVDIGVGVS